MQKGLWCAIPFNGIENHFERFHGNFRRLRETSLEFSAFMVKLALWGTQGVGERHADTFKFVNYPHRASGNIPGCFARVVYLI